MDDLDRYVKKRMARSPEFRRIYLRNRKWAIQYQEEDGEWVTVVSGHKCAREAKEQLRSMRRIVWQDYHERYPMRVVRVR